MKFLTRMLSAAGRRIAGVFELDLRSLAVFRMALACILLWDLAFRATDLTAHYSDLGVLPRNAFMEGVGNAWWFSLHMLNGKTFYQGVLFAVHGVAALCLLLGYRTRLATVVCWVLLVSLHNRNPALNNAGDDLFRFLFLWSMFLPLGARWSLDAGPSGDKRTSGSVLSGATVGLTLQVCFVYWFTVLRRGDSTWWSGEAVGTALQLDFYATSLGIWIREHPSVASALTYFTIYLETIGGILLLSPVLTGIVRTIVITLFVILHAGIATSMALGIFPFVSVTALLPLLPSDVWNTVERRSRLIQTRLGTSVSRLLARARIKTRLRSTDQLSGESRPWLATDAVCVVLIVAIFLWDVRVLGKNEYRSVFPDQLRPALYVLRIEQGWGMFSPNPRGTDGWLVAPGTLLDGTVVDVYRGGVPVNWEKPEWIVWSYPNSRWREYLKHIVLPDWDEYRLYYGQYVSRTWNDAHTGNQRVRSFDIYYVRESAHAPPDTEPERIRIWRHRSGL